ncbi:MAG: tetratricopeptide repeat protein [Sedimentisphaerales bacterium]|nr:tetratricopeptide repeat protein [Sedimentisphaerales bacterium]MBN2842798.1 tetratricopeptide repeat protein [Sedimentisphaerales bacterium]
MKKALVVIVLALTVFIAGCRSMEAIELNQKAKIYIKHGQYEQAAEVLNQSLDKYASHASTHYWLGYCYEKMENLTKATWEYELAVKYDPTLEMAQIGYIRALVRSRQEEEAVKVADAYFRRLNVPTSEYIRIGQKYLEAEEEIFAAKCLEYAFRNSGSTVPNSPIKKDVRPLMVLADYYAATKNQEKERQYLMMIFEEDPSYDNVARRLGELGIKVNIPQPVLPTISPLERELKGLD